MTKKTNRVSSAIQLAVIVGLLATCGPAGTGVDSPLDTPASGQATIPGEAQEIASLVKLDLAEQLGVSADEIDVVSARPVDWPDSSLGCPKPDFMYAQTITPGFQVVMETGGEQYVYHTGTDHFVWCEASTAIEAPGRGTRVDARAAALVARAQEDLSQQLGIAADQIGLVSVEAVEWSDASLGCPEADKMYAQVITPGYRIVFSASGEEYAYHANAEKAVICEGQPTDIE